MVECRLVAETFVEIVVGSLGLIARIVLLGPVLLPAEA